MAGENCEIIYLASSAVNSTARTIDDQAHSASGLWTKDSTDRHDVLFGSEMKQSLIILAAKDFEVVRFVDERVLTTSRTR